jgi:hypothetical protein
MGHRFDTNFATRLLATTALGLTLVAVPAFATPYDQASQGPSSSQTPYLLPSLPSYGVTSLLTVGDTVGGYQMAGIPDGLGAFDNGNGTVTVLLNHEIGAGQGAAHGPLGAGAFVSKWTIDKNTLQVLSGSNLITSFSPATGTTSLDRLCSSDLPPISAFYNSATGLGYNGYIYMSGEESTNGRAVGTVVTGAGAVGTAYQLTRLGQQAWENLLANPGTGNKTVVMGSDDSSPGQMFVYVGDKTNSGTAADMAGLSNGLLYAIKLNGLTTEVRTSTPASTTFSLVPIGAAGDVTGLNGGQINTSASAQGATSFLRPEDGAWNPKNKNQFFFVTTDQFDQVKDGQGATIGRSRLWQVDFADASNPLLGGTIKPVIDGTGPTQMLDNMTVDADGIVWLQEDVGGNAHNGKIWRFDPNTGALTEVFHHDVARFGDNGVPATAPYNNDEESSGIIDVTELFDDASWYHGGKVLLADVQAHYGLPSPLIQGGQLLLLVETPEPAGLAAVMPALAALYLRRRRKARAYRKPSATSEEPRPRKGPRSFRGKLNACRDSGRRRRRSRSRPRRGRCRPGSSWRS